ILAKRSARVLKLKRQQLQAHKNLRKAVDRNAPKKEIDALVAKLAEAHELLDKAILGKEEAEKREEYLAEKVKILKKKTAERSHRTSGASVPDAPWNPNKLPIANWIIPWLWKTWNAGCHFEVTSGYRSPQYQCTVCTRLCGNCGGCPGRCAAPGTSNHG